MLFAWILPVNLKHIALNKSTSILQCGPNAHEVCILSPVQTFDTNPDLPLNYAEIVLESDYPKTSRQEFFERYLSSHFSVAFLTHVADRLP